MVGPQREIKIPEELDFLLRRVGSLRGSLKFYCEGFSEEEEFPKGNIKWKERGGNMAKIKWETEWKEALARARAEKKPVLVDFFNPG